MQTFKYKYILGEATLAVTREIAGKENERDRTSGLCCRREDPRRPLDAVTRSRQRPRAQSADDRGRKASCCAMCVGASARNTNYCWMGDHRLLSVISDFCHRTRQRSSLVRVFSDKAKRWSAKQVAQQVFHLQEHHFLRCCNR